MEVSSWNNNNKRENGAARKNQQLQESKKKYQSTPEKALEGEGYQEEHRRRVCLLTEKAGEDFDWGEPP